MQIIVTPSQITRSLSVVVLLLITAHVGYLFMRYGLGYDNLLGFGPLFDMWREHNLPNLYASMTLFFCALLSFLISLSERRSDGGFALHWLGLAVLLAFVSADEMVMIHEHLIRPLRASLGTSGIFYFAWVIPYGIAVIVLGVIYLRFFRKLAPHTRTLMAVAAAVYIGGAVGLEMLGAVEYEKAQSRTLLLDVYALIEETMEMVGVLILIRALTGEIARRELQLQFSPALLPAGHVQAALAGRQVTGPRSDDFLRSR